MDSRPPASELSTQSHLRRESSVSRTVIGFNAELTSRKIVWSRKQVIGKDPSPNLPGHSTAGDLATWSRPVEGVSLWP